MKFTLCVHLLILCYSKFIEGNKINKVTWSKCSENLNWYFRWKIENNLFLKLQSSTSDVFLSMYLSRQVKGLGFTVRRVKMFSRVLRQNSALIFIFFFVYFSFLLALSISRLSDHVYIVHHYLPQYYLWTPTINLSCLVS